MSLDKKSRLIEVKQKIRDLQKEQSELESQIEREKTPLERYQSTNSYRKLFEKYSLSDVGVWKVLGEDPNCDLGGSHHQPNLGLFEGTLEAVIKHAVELPQFWQWGGGGDIEKVKAPTITKL